MTKDGFPFLVHYRSCRDLDDRLSGRHRDVSDDEVEPSREAIRLSIFHPSNHVTGAGKKTNFSKTNTINVFLLFLLDKVFEIKTDAGMVT